MLLFQTSFLFNSFTLFFLILPLIELLYVYSYPFFKNGHDKYQINIMW